MLGKPVKSQIKKRITSVVDDWLDAAYVAGKYPRSDFTAAFPHFTRGATQRARNDDDLMSNATIGARIDSVRAMNRQLKIDGARRRVTSGGRHSAGGPRDAG